MVVSSPCKEGTSLNSLGGLQSKIQEAKFAIDDELSRSTDMEFRLKLVVTANSLRNLEEQIYRRS
jgi:hypothetical protein